MVGFKRVKVCMGKGERKNRSKSISTPSPKDTISLIESLPSPQENHLFLSALSASALLVSSSKVC